MLKLGKLAAIRERWCEPDSLAHLAAYKDSIVSVNLCGPEPMGMDVNLSGQVGGKKEGRKLIVLLEGSLNTGVSLPRPE